MTVTKIWSCPNSRLKINSWGLKFFTLLKGGKSTKFVKVCLLIPSWIELFYWKYFFFRVVSWDKKKLYGSFLWMGFNCLKATEPLQGDNLIYTIKSLGAPGTHQTDLGRIRGWVDLGATWSFWIWDSWIGNPACYQQGHCPKDIDL